MIAINSERTSWIHVVEQAAQDSLGLFLGREEGYGLTSLRCVLFVEEEDDDVGRGKNDLLVVFISLPRG